MTTVFSAELSWESMENRQCQQNWLSRFCTVPFLFKDLMVASNLVSCICHGFLPVCLSYGFQSNSSRSGSSKVG
ncbi:hypothetical protein H5410_042909 [Solanum commersonii]|uniref:Uncharacterized protein n=1 Tax=Solanum commersonii TaxID=4109 RepID=A0A9J5XVP1_SOLCO|nr:hypothetical protein H5410_042909 [Solanum commersonii]